MNWKQQILPHLLALAGFLILAYTYCSPQFSGKVLQQGDITQYKGMAQEARSYEEKLGEQMLWTNSMFGGMPAYQINKPKTLNLTKYLDKALKLGLPRPGSYIFLCLLGFYLLMSVLGVQPLLSAVGAIAFTFSTYNFLILEAGHNTKFLAISYIAPVIAGVLLAYRGKILMGSSLFALALALNITVNHFQITYYLLLLLLIYGIVEFIHALQQQRLPEFAKTSGALVIAGLLGIGANTAHLLSTYEYTPETIRGPSELKSAENSGNGLDKDYALAWSYGKMETMNLLIPRFVGGASGESISKDSQTSKLLRRSGQRGNVGPMYWGAQPFTGGPTYIGAIVIFLFLLGSFLVRGPWKWWLIVATLLSILLAWGKNLMWFTDFFFYYFPMYNKFRVVSMTLVITQFTMPFLGMWALHKIITNQYKQADILRALKWSGGILGGILLLFIVLGGGILDFEGVGDARYPDAFVKALIADRQSMMQIDAFRSLALIALAAGTIWAFVQQKIKAKLAIIIIGILILGDLWTVNRRYLNNENFISAKQNEAAFNKSKADKAILADADPNYRVLNIAVNTFNNATTSYHHKSIGGYHGAKLRRYQDVIDNYLQKSIQSIQATLQNNPSPESINEAFAQQKVLNMLNAKYLIYNPDAAPITNSHAMGNVWFVGKTKIVADANEEIATIGATDLAQTAVIDKRFSNYVEGKQFSASTGNSIQLTDYQPNKLTYSAKTSGEQLAIFSEIYYNNGKGWNAYIDGEKVKHIRTNYLLRGLLIPSGEHKIEFKFEPVSLQRGNFISLICSLIVLLGFFGLVGQHFKNLYAQKSSQAIVSTSTDTQPEVKAAPLSNKSTKKRKKR